MAKNLPRADANALARVTDGIGRCIGCNITITIGRSLDTGMPAYIALLRLFSSILESEKPEIFLALRAGLRITTIFLTTMTATLLGQLTKVTHPWDCRE
uniref:Uncharacterized protein n=1 Tax=Romanomermis culicivorax TaxID=13658 RepID=A0A915L3F2_ROMCU